MSSATKNLENDHVYILRLIDVMEHITHTDKPNISHLENIVDIIKNYADGTHHAKEENLFFPFLAERGFSTTQGPIGVMLHEHVIGRNYVKGISDNINLYKNGDNAALNEIYINMKGYVDLLRNHISKENNILFRMADNVLSESDHKLLLDRFDEAEKNHESPELSDDYIRKIQDMVSYYNL